MVARSLLLVGLLGGATAEAAGSAASPGLDRTLGVVIGTVSLSLQPRGQHPPRYYRGPYRASHEDDPAPAPTQSVVVYVQDVPAPADGWSVPADPALMRQRHDRFVPHVLPVMRGRTVSFPNDDNYFHNVFSIVAGDRFDLGRYGEGDTRLQTFQDPAVVVVRCEIHPGMKAFILVRDNPLFTIPDASGHFTLRGIPSGTWSIVVWHPMRASLRRTVTVRPGEPATLDISF